MVKNKYFQGLISIILSVLFLSSFMTDNVKMKSLLDEQNEFTSAVEFNDALLGKVTILDVKYAELADLDAIDTSAKVLEASVLLSIEESKKVIKDIKQLKPFGVNAERFKQAGLDLANAFYYYVKEYQTLVDIFSIADDKWTDEQFNRWDKFDIKYHEDYLIAGDVFNATQQSFFRVNSIEQGEIIDADKIYQEQK